jgi:hypothetical protein
VVGHDAGIGGGVDTELGSGEPGSKPPAKAASVAAYDPATQQFVLFGGGDSQNQPTSDT